MTVEIQWSQVPFGQEEEVEDAAKQAALEETARRVAELGGDCLVIDPNAFQIGATVEGEAYTYRRK